MRTLNLADLTAENVMTPRVQVIALDVQATCEDVANATRATGLSRFPVYRATWTRSSASPTSRTYWRCPPSTGPVRAVVRR